MAREIGSLLISVFFRLAFHVSRFGREFEIRREWLSSTKNREYARRSAVDDRGLVVGRDVRHGLDPTLHLNQHGMRARTLGQFRRPFVERQHVGIAVPVERADEARLVRVVPRAGLQLSDPGAYRI